MSYLCYWWAVSVSALTRSKFLFVTEVTVTLAAALWALSQSYAAMWGALGTGALAFVFLYGLVLTIEVWRWHNDTAAPGEGNFRIEVYPQLSVFAQTSKTPIYLFILYKGSGIARKCTARRVHDPHIQYADRDPWTFLWDSPHPHTTEMDLRPDGSHARLDIGTAGFLTIHGSPTFTPAVLEVSDNTHYLGEEGLYRGDICISLSAEAPHVSTRFRISILANMTEDNCIAVQTAISKVDSPPPSMTPFKMRPNPDTPADQAESEGSSRPGK